MILPEEPSINAILAVAKALVLRKGIRGLVIDPWNEIEHGRTQGQTETEYISIVLSRIRQFARAHGVHVWLVAHPAKLFKEANGKYPVPGPYDVSGSAHWRNKADCCLAVWA
jgi:twinkle protein